MDFGWYEASMFALLPGTDIRAEFPRHNYYLEVDINQAEYVQQITPVWEDHRCVLGVYNVATLHNRAPVIYCSSAPL